MELATINSREFQTRKELLFVTALALTRRRYQFELNPTPFGNGIGADYRHVRNNGIEQNQLLVPSGVAVQRTLATGGEFLARFANSVVLTFNGPSGFAKDISSNLVFDFQQTIFQRDVRFENLTQAERDVVYAMREYLRFRKQLFRDVANQYYNCCSVIAVSKSMLRTTSRTCEASFKVKRSIARQRRSRVFKLTNSNKTC